jgi:hypothetical protein
MLHWIFLWCYKLNPNLAIIPLDVIKLIVAEIKKDNFNAPYLLQNSRRALLYKSNKNLRSFNDSYYCMIRCGNEILKIGCPIIFNVKVYHSVNVICMTIESKSIRENILSCGCNVYIPIWLTIRIPRYDCNLTIWLKLNCSRCKATLVHTTGYQFCMS